MCDFHAFFFFFFHAFRPSTFYHLSIDRFHTHTLLPTILLHHRRHHHHPNAVCVRSISLALSYAPTRDFDESSPADATRDFIRTAAVRVTTTTTTTTAVWLLGCVSRKRELNKRQTTRGSGMMDRCVCVCACCVCASPVSPFPRTRRAARDHPAAAAVDATPARSVHSGCCWCCQPLSLSSTSFWNPSRPNKTPRRRRRRRRRRREEPGAGWEE